VDERSPTALNVLVVEDRARNREVMEILLAQIHAIPTCVADGADAMKRFGSERYDVILMATQMSESDGLEFTRITRGREHASRPCRTRHSGSLRCPPPQPITPEARSDLIAALTQGAGDSAVAIAG
jgi:CheY-like chemotaxis protein